MDPISDQLLWYCNFAASEYDGSDDSEDDNDDDAMSMTMPMTITMTLSLIHI